MNDLHTAANWLPDLALSSLLEALLLLAALLWIANAADYVLNPLLLR